MKYLGSISDGKDLVNKEYVDGRSGVKGVKGSSESSYRTGNVNLTAANVGAIPTSRKVNGKALSADITLSASDVGAATSGHTHATTIATSTGTNQITLSHGAKYSITAGGTSYVFTMPSAPSVPSITLNGSSTTSPSFYAPTSAGTSGYYLKSNGSGAPTWAAFPSIPTIPSNNVTGSGTSGQLAQWNGAHTITSGPKVTVSTSGPSGGSNGDIWFVHS